MFVVQRIYDYQPERQDFQTAVFIDRLYPRGIAKEKMAAVEWLKDLTPSTPLRRWYHENPEQYFEAFAVRYVGELQGERQQQAIGRLKTLAAGNRVVLLLTAVKHPVRSHVSVLEEYLGERFIYR